MESRIEKIDYILESIEEDGYLEIHDQSKLELIEEALRLLKAVYVWDSIP